MPTRFYIQSAVFGNLPDDLANRINAVPSTLAIVPGPMTPTAYLAVGRMASICDRAGQLFDENLDGQIAEVIVYSRKLTLSEQRDLEAYLSVKYGIALGAPVPALGPMATTVLVGALALSVGLLRRISREGRPIPSRGA